MSKSKSMFVYLVTHGIHSYRNQSLLATLQNLTPTRIILPIFPSVRELGMDMNTLIRLSSLFIKALFAKGYYLLDINSTFFHPYFIKKYILDFGTPLSVEIAWLGHRKLSILAKKWERLIIKHANFVFAANEHMEKYCKELGACKTGIVGMYPPSNFKPRFSRHYWRKKIGLNEEDKMAIFIGSMRFREIYGFDLLLDAWRLVERSLDNAHLFILGPRPVPGRSYDWIANEIHKRKLKNVHHVGWQPEYTIPDWINAADICLAPRTPGFPSKFYNEKDSTKIAQYAALRKPIVAAGYAKSKAYLLVKRTPKDFCEGILQGFEGKCPIPEPHFWEENIPVIIQGLRAAGFLNL